MGQYLYPYVGITALAEFSKSYLNFKFNQHKYGLIETCLIKNFN